MSYFGSERMTGEQIFNEASKSGMSPLKVAISANGYLDSFKYWSSSEEMSCVKLSYKYGVVVHKIKRLCGNDVMVCVSQLYRQIREVQPFVGRDGIYNDLSNNILPSLQDAGIICRIGDQIFVHPALVGMYERDVYNWCSQYRSDAPRSHYVEPMKPPTIHGYDADEVENAIRFFRKAKTLLNGEY